MATSKQRMKRIADDIGEAAGKSSVKIQDKASDAAKDIRQAGRDLDDRVRQTAGAASEYVEDKTGIAASKSRPWAIVAVWLTILAGLIALGWLGARLL